VQTRLTDLHLRPAYIIFVKNIAMNPIIEQKLPEIRALCKKYHVERLYLFGSATTDNFNDKSDVDLLMAFDEKLSPLERGENYFELHYAFEALFGRDIDLLTENSLSNPYFIASVERSKQLLYAA
jgi:predicted nucleotidyltransferase